MTRHAAARDWHAARIHARCDFGINGRNRPEEEEQEEEEEEEGGAEKSLIYISDYVICINDSRAFSIISIGNIIFHVLNNFARTARKPAHYVHRCYCYRPMLNNNGHVRRVSVRATLFNGGLLADGRTGGRTSGRANKRRSYFTRSLLIR